MGLRNGVRFECLHSGVVASVDEVRARVETTVVNRQSGGPIRRDVQGLRGVAVLAVMAYHVDRFLPGGFLGVDVFFVISGFVITSSLVRETERTGTFSLSGFFARRARRLLPASAVVILTSLAIGFFTQSPLGPGQALGHTARAASLSVANFNIYGQYQYFAPAAERNPLLHTWSLSVEEQFYLVFALAAALAITFATSARRALFVVGGVALVASFFLNLRWTAAGDVDGLLNSTRFAFFSPYSRAFEFAAGVLVALLPSAYVADRFRAFFGGLGVAGLVFSFAVIDSGWTIPRWAVCVPVAATAFLLLAGDRGRVGAAFGGRVLVWVGDRSYGLYLWHWPLLVFAARIGEGLWPVAIAMSFALAALSFRFVEEPFRTDRTIVGRRALVLAIICIVVPLIVATAFLRAMDAGLGIAGVEELRGRAEAREIGCHTDLDEPVLSLDECTWRADSARGTIMLVGDSHAVSLSDAVVDFGVADDYDVVVRTRSLCPFHGRRIKRQGCAEYQRDTVEEILQVQPDVVVIANRAPSYINPTVGDGPFPIVDDEDRETTTLAEGVRAWDEGLRSTIDQIRASSGLIVIVDTVPEFKPGTASESISLISRSGSHEVLTTNDVVARRGTTSEVHTAIARDVSEVSVFDPVPILCLDTCTQRVDGEWTYYDDDHLSLRGAELLGSSIRAYWKTE